MRVGKMNCCRISESLSQEISRCLDGQWLCEACVMTFCFVYRRGIICRQFIDGFWWCHDESSLPIVIEKITYQIWCSTYFYLTWHCLFDIKLVYMCQATWLWCSLLHFECFICQVHICQEHKLVEAARFFWFIFLFIFPPFCTFCTLFVLLQWSLRQFVLEQ